MDLLDVFVLAVYAQPLLWMWLYDKTVPLKPWMFQVGGVALTGIIAYFHVGYGFYTPEILCFYTLAVVYCIYYYRDQPGINPVCLAMLIVFLNSYFWEFPLHFGNIFSGHIGLVIFQSAHLYPVPWLLNRGFKLPDRWWYWSCASWIPLVVLDSMKLILNMPISYSIINLAARTIGIITLTWILRFPGQPELRLISVVREGLARYDRHTK